MEIPVVNRIIADGELPVLANSVSTSVISHLLSSPVAQIGLLFKWSALTIAFLASLTTLVKGIKVFLLNSYYLRSPVSSSQEPLVDDSDYDSDGPSTSVSYPPSDHEDEMEESNDEDFSVKGGNRWPLYTSGLRRRKSGSLVDLSSLFTTGKNVVKLWENATNLGLGSPAARDRGNLVPSLFPTDVVLPTEGNLSGRFLKLWETRADGWEFPLRNNAVAHVNRTGSILVRDGVTGEMRAGDVRKAGSPFVAVTEADVDAWWDADED